MVPEPASSSVPSATSKALSEVPPYPFIELERKAAAWRRGNERAVNLSMGDPDLPPPAAVVRAAEEALRAPSSHRYPTSRGEAPLRESIARWMKVRFGVKVDPATEVAVLLGSKEGIAALPRALLDPGDSVLVPDPGYPPYGRSAHLAHLRSRTFPLQEERGWLPNLEELPRDGKLLFLNYPNNPTGGTASLEDLRASVDAARDRRFWLAFDNAYSEVTYGEYRAPSILELPGAMERCVEFHSFSKTFGLAGWRIGFAVGNAQVLASLVKLKSQGDSGASRPVQTAATAALDLYHGPDRPPEVEVSVREYGRRLSHLSSGLKALGWDAPAPRGSLYLWQKAPKGGSGAEFASWLLSEHGILVTPGASFGSRGASFVRWAVTAPPHEIDTVLERLNRGPTHP